MVLTNTPSITNPKLPRPLPYEILHVRTNRTLRFQRRNSNSSADLASPSANTNANGSGRDSVSSPEQLPG